MLLITCNREMNSLRAILIVGIIVAFVWEFIAPHMKKGSVTDFGDILCYIISSIGYWGLLKLSKEMSGEHANCE